MKNIIPEGYIKNDNFVNVYNKSISIHNFELDHRIVFGYVNNKTEYLTRHLITSIENNGNIREGESILISNY